MKRQRVPLIGLIVVVIVAAVAVSQWHHITRLFSGAQPYAFHGSVVEPPGTAPDFTLVDQDGQPYTLSEQRGQAVLLFFGYTHCPDVCPQTLVDFMHIKEALGERADEVQFVFITLDPGRDTPEVIGDYVALFDSEFIGLSGDTVALQNVWEAYGTFAQATDPDEKGHYWVIHSSYTYAIDKSGQLRVIYSFDTPRGDILNDVQHIVG